MKTSSLKAILLRREPRAGAASSARSGPSFAALTVRGRDAGTGRLLECEIRGGQIVRMRAASGRAPRGCVGGNDLYLSAGFMDIQVNGFAGTDLESPTVNAEDVLRVTRSQWPYGVTRYLPTIVTGSGDRIRRGLRAVADAVAQFPEVRAGVAGIHLEGPYFCPEEGPRGAHPLEHVRPPSWEEFRTFQRAARGLIRMVTLAPEQPGAIPFIRRLAAAGVVPAIGHHNAREEDIDAAIRAGAKICTHLGNGSHNVLPRHANYLQMQLARDELWASFITDGQHLPWYFFKNAVRAKGVSRCVVITDAMSAAGGPPGRYRIGDTEVVVGPDRVVRHPVSACLAGSAGTLDQCVTNAIRWAGLTLAEGLAMVTSQPAKLLGLRSHGLARGKAAYLTLFRWRDRLEVTHTIVGGKLVFQA